MGVSPRGRPPSLSALRPAAPWRQTEHYVGPAGIVKSCRGGPGHIAFAQVRGAFGSRSAVSPAGASRTTSMSFDVDVAGRAIAGRPSPRHRAAPGQLQRLRELVAELGEQPGDAGGPVGRQRVDRGPAEEHRRGPERQRGQGVRGRSALPRRRTPRRRRPPRPPRRPGSRRWRRRRSSWRPPWLETQTAAAPASTHRRASSGRSTPLTTTGSPVARASHSTSCGPRSVAFVAPGASP